MGYSFRKVWLMMKHHKRIYLLLILELAVGMCMYVYSCNLSASLKKAAEGLEQESVTYFLRITEKAGQSGARQAPISFKDYTDIQSLAGQKAELFVQFPDIMFTEGEVIDYTLLFLDFQSRDLDDSYVYIGSHIPSGADAGQFTFGNRQISLEQDRLILQMEESSVTFQARTQPTAVQNERLTFVETGQDLELSDCILLPLAEMDAVYGAIQPEMAKFELRVYGEGLPDIERTLEEISHNLNRAHGEAYTYEFYSPIEEFSDSTYKTKLDISAIHKIGILLLCTLFVASISIFRLLLERRERELGVCQACGAGAYVIAMEIFEEILLICLTGTAVGCAAGAFLTCNLTSFLAGGVEMTIHLQVFLQAFFICMLIVVIVSIATIKKAYTKSIIEQIRG